MINSSLAHLQIDCRKGLKPSSYYKIYVLRQYMRLVPSHFESFPSDNLRYHVTGVPYRKRGPWRWWSPRGQVQRRWDGLGRGKGRWSAVRRDRAQSGPARVKTSALLPSAQLPGDDVLRQ